MGAPWFGPKSYGIGLSPSSAPGWIALAVYVAAMVAAPLVARLFAAPAWALQLALAALTVGFVSLAVIKSDRRPWRWRWGGR